MYVEDAVFEGIDEFDRIDQLVHQVAGVKVDTEGRVVIDSF